MVAVKNHEADRYIASLPNSLCVYLVFGPDTGLVSERVSGILRKVIEDRHDPFQMVTMAGDDIAEKPGQLIEEVNTIGLFQAKRAVHVTAGSKSFVEAIRILVAEPPKDCTVVISAGAMRPDAPLRSTCTRAKNAAAIECYPDQDRDLARLIDDSMRDAGLRISASGKSALVAALGADRLTTRAEIDKLILYAHGNSEVTEEDVYAVVADAAGHAYEDAVDAAFLGKRSEASEVYSAVAATGENVAVLVSACIRRCTLLHRMCVDIESGMSRDQVMEKNGLNRLPPFRKNSLGAQLSMWRSHQLIALLERLEDMSFRIRIDDNLAPLMAARMLWTIASNRSPGRSVRS